MKVLKNSSSTREKSIMRLWIHHRTNTVITRSSRKIRYWWRLILHLLVQEKGVH